MSLNETEKTILNALIKECVERMSSKCSNDFMLPDTPEGWRLAEDFCQFLYEGQGEEKFKEKPQLVVYDWILFKLLLKKIGLH